MKCDFDAVGVCKECTAVKGVDECPYATLDPTLLDASKAIQTTAKGACDLESGVCEACQ